MSAETVGSFPNIKIVQSGKPAEFNDTIVSLLDEKGNTQGNLGPNTDPREAARKAASRLIAIIDHPNIGR